MRGIYKYIKPYGPYMLLTLFLKFAAALMDLLIPSLLARIIDDIVPLKNEGLIFLWGGIMIVCAVISVTTNITANRMAEVSAGGMTRKMRYDLFTKVSYLSAAQMDEFTVPSVVSRLTSDTYNVNRMFARMQRIGVRGPILLVGGICITMTMSPKLTLVLIATLPVIAVIVALITGKSIPLYDKEQSVLDDMVRVLRENITGVRVIRALSKTEYEKNRFDKVNGGLADVEQKAGSISAISNPATTLVLNLGLTAVIITGAFLVQKGETGVGTIIAFLSYFTIILNAMLGVTRIFMILSKGMASARRITQILESPDDMPVLPYTGGMESEYHVEFKKVTFSYLHKRNNLTDVSFALKKGETLGIIGATGSGKSTVINLLLRFYDRDQGDILINGRDIKTIPLTELRRKFGVVFQNDYLMADSIEKNVDYFRGISKEDIEKAADYAQASEFIQAKKGDMDADVAIRGNNLSGGQKQRIMIARALAASPEILILDDASSALDYQTDALLRKTLREHFSETTTIMIAQRISSIQEADHILVMEDSKCIGCGTHKELLAGCEIYRQIYELQAGMTE
ncbi:MAG: ABC transporter ATP-binding protein [Lachnospiraceae bacterium]|nr:ABC transporter ATP-binding protein [Lachnospiraceae bacterium]